MGARPYSETRLKSTLVIALLSLGAAPKSAVHQKLADHCLLWAAEPSNPWALAHGMTALGASFVTADGRVAADAIVQDFLLRPTPDGGSGPRFAFQKYALDGTPVEPHLNLLTKTFVKAGLPLSRVFKTKQGDVRLGELVEAVEQGFSHRPQDALYWQQIGWTLDLLSHLHKPGDAFVGAGGVRYELSKVMDDALAALEAADQELLVGMDKRLPQVDKRKQGIYAHSCGGVHFAEAVFSWARHPSVRKAWGARLDRQIDVLFYRLESERRQYEAALQQAPEYALQVLVQMVKFYGHFLEATGRLKKETGWKPTKPQQEAVLKATVLLDAAVKALEERKAFASMTSLKSSQRQIYLDLIGDSCHAANGLELWR